MGIRCSYPQSCPVAEKLTVVHMSWPPNKGRASGWSRPSHESASQPPPMAVRSHSTRSMAASKALISGVALQEVCDAAGCSSPHTFVRFYSLTWTLPQVPKCSRPSAARKIHTGQALVAMVMLYWRSQSVFTQWSSLERERSVTTVTSVPWRGNERCIPGHISFVPVSDLLRLLSQWQLRLGRLYSLLVHDVTCSDVPITPWIDYTCASRLITQSVPKACLRNVRSLFRELRLQS